MANLGIKKTMIFSITHWNFEVMHLKNRFNEMFSLEGRVALVTGAGKGIGQAIAVAMAEAGADIILHTHQTSLDETIRLLEQIGRNYATFTLDLSVPEIIVEAVQRLLLTYQVDILVNNAGVIKRTEARDYHYEDWSQVLNTNLNSLFLLTQSIAQPMLERRCGKIINIASLLSFQGGINVVAYTASKHAVMGLTKSLANEWAYSGIQVNAIAPGYIVTENTRPLRENDQRMLEIESRIPTGRWGKPEDLGGAAVFLASKGSDYVNGHTLVVDGGWMVR